MKNKIVRPITTLMTSMFFFIPSSYATKDIVTKLENAILEVKKDLILGSWTSYSDMDRTDGGAYDDSDMARYEYIDLKSPEGIWKKFRLQEIDFSTGGTFAHLMERVKASRKARAGVCVEQSLLLLHNIWSKAKRYPEINRIEIIGLEKFNHVFALINRKKGSSLANYRTWGKDAYVADPWAGNAQKSANSGKSLPAVYPAHKFYSEMRTKLPNEIKNGLKIGKEFAGCEPFHLVREIRDIRKFLSGIITPQDLRLYAHYDINPKQDSFKELYKKYLKSQCNVKPVKTKMLPADLQKELKDTVQVKEFLKTLKENEIEWKVFNTLLEPTRW